MKSILPPILRARLARAAEDSGRAQQSTVPSEVTSSSDAQSTLATTDRRLSRADGFLDDLWHEHAVLASDLARLESAADGIVNEQLPVGTLSSGLDRAYELFAGRIVPHIRAADNHQTAFARRDYVSPPPRREHEEAERLTSELGRLRERVSAGNIAGARSEARRLLYELGALTRPHFAVPRGPKAMSGQT
jgi:hypothetical protein